MFACLAAPRDAADAIGPLLQMAREWSPRVERHGERAVVLDVDGVERLFGAPAVLGEALRRAATEALNAPVPVAMAGTRIAAVVLACARPGLTIVPPGGEAEAMAALPLAWLTVLEGPGGPRALASSRSSGRAGRRRARGSARHHRMAPVPEDGARAGRSPGAPAIDLVATLRRWGLRTLGEFTALPPAGVSERLGEAGLVWQRLARGEDPGPLVPVAEEARYEESLALEWPIEGLEPLSFALGRLLESLCERLMRDDRGAATLSTRLRLVTREIHSRTLQLPLPFRDPRVLRTLAILDLESHPPPAGVDVVHVAVDPVPGRVVQASLLERARPSAEQLSTLRARIQALMGEGRSGAPQLVDTHRPGAFVLGPFEGERRAGGARVGSPDRGTWPGTVGMSGAKPLVLSAEASCCDGNAEADRGRPVSRSDMPAVQVADGRATGALRRFRHPLPAEVTLHGGGPARVRFAWGDLRGGDVQACAGPWRTSGDWWRSGAGDRTLPPWDHDEWDVALAGGGVYRIYRDRTTGRWYVAAMID